MKKKERIATLETEVAVLKFHVDRLLRLHNLTNAVYAGTDEEYNLQMKVHDAFNPTR